LFEGLIYQFVYKLERHRLLNIRLRHWLILLCLVLPAMMWLRVWGAGRVTAIFVTLGAVSVLVAIGWAGRQHYVRFVEHVRDVAYATPPGNIEEARGRASQGAVDPSSAESPLPAMSKVRVRATGFFEVSGMRRYLVERRADYTTFETREHCVMAQMPFSRFLLLGTFDRDEVGWWYTFFQPEMIRSVSGGMLYYGLRPRPALQLQIAADHQSEVLYLSFEDEATRSLVLADLQLDATPE
jgi:hypothetical protein